MSSKSVDLADAITEVLNDAENTFVLQFEALRRAAPLSLAELEESKDLRVSVFTGTRKAERVSRSRFKRTYKPIILVQRKLDQATDEANLAQADTLVELTEQITEFLEDIDFDALGLSFVAFDEERDTEEYNPEAMMAAGMFMHAMILEYTTG